jgi:hypothetical protein
LPSLSRRRNHDPYWGLDGPAARQTRRRRLVREGVAFGSAVVAVAGAAFVWFLHLGVAHAGAIALVVRPG